MSNFPTLDPVVVDRGAFRVERLLERPGRVEVERGDRVASGDVVARTENIEKSFTLYLANELGVPNDSLRKYLTKSIGSAVSEGEPIARVRRGLRTAAVKSPATGTLIHVDDAEGTVTLTASSGPKELVALVDGVVEEVYADHGVAITTSGSRIYGIVGFGAEATGRLVVGSDRHDRELTADQVSSDWRGAIVLAGMTVGVPALNKMRDAGVAGVIVGSISEGDIRRYIAPQDAAGVASFWSQDLASLGAAARPVIVVTEGFGRIPMADPIYEFLKTKAGFTVSMTGRTATGHQLARPEMYIAEDAGSGAPAPAAIEPARQVRVVDAHRLGLSGTVVSGPTTGTLSNGLLRDYVEVEFENNEREMVPAENVEIVV